jgi:hypothetical protein
LTIAAIRLKKGQFQLAPSVSHYCRGLTVAVVFTQISFVVVNVALVFVAILAVRPHITAVVINVALVVIAIHSVMVEVLLQALTIPAILSTFTELSPVPRYIAVVCISISTIFVQIAPVVVDVTLVAISVAPILVEIVVVSLLICRFNCGSLRCRVQCQHTCQCNSDKTMSDDSFDFHVDPPCSITFFIRSWLNTWSRKKFWPIWRLGRSRIRPIFASILDTLWAWHSSPCRWRAQARASPV